MIDWSKPIRVTATKAPARAVADIIKNGKACKVVLYNHPILKEEYVTTVKLDTHFVENVPEEIEKEVYLTLHKNGYVLATSDKNTARMHRGSDCALAQKAMKVKFVKGEFPDVAPKI